MATVAWDSGRTKTLTIANGQTESDILDLGANPRGGLSGSKAYRVLDMLIDAPATLSGTVKPYVCSTAGGTFVPLQSGGTDIALPAGKSTPIVPITARFLKLVSGGAEGGDRAFILTATARNIGR